MRKVSGDLAACAVVAQAYGLGDVADNLYGLAQYGCHMPPPMQPGDVQFGLHLMGLDSFRLVSDDDRPPKMVGFAIAEGHIVLAQVRGEGEWDRLLWAIVTSADEQGWAGIIVGWDMIAHGISSRLRFVLSGHYVITATPLPDWEVDPT